MNTNQIHLLRFSVVLIAFCDNKETYNILTDRQFAKAREALASKRKQLRRQGKGQRPNKALGLSSEQIDKLWSTEQLSNKSPQSLLRTVWFNNTLHFGWRARDEHHRVRLGDLQLQKKDGPNGREYVIWKIERGSKTRTGEEETVPDRLFSPKMFATKGPRCPVAMFKQYIAKRPPDMLTPDSPFYLAAIKSPSSDMVWYKRQPLGKNSLANFMKSMSTAAGLTGHFTNHSVRRTMIFTLRHENVNPLNIIGLAGQRNLKSLDSYSETSNQQQKDMSLKLSKHVEGTSSARQPERSALKPLATSNNLDTNQSSMFSGAVFNHCSFSFGHGHDAAVNAAVSSADSTLHHPRSDRPQSTKKFERTHPVLDSSDEEL